MQVGIRCCGSGHRGKAGGEAIDGVGGAGHIGADRFLCDGGGGAGPFSESTGFSCYADGVSLRGCARSLLQNVLPQARVCLSIFASALAVPCKCADFRLLPPNFTESTRRMRKLQIGPQTKKRVFEPLETVERFASLTRYPGSPYKATHQHERGCFNAKRAELNGPVQAPFILALPDSLSMFRPYLRAGRCLRVWPQSALYEADCRARPGAPAQREARAARRGSASTTRAP